MKRNLLYYLYPRKWSIWPWHLQRLISYQGAWNGRRIIYVALDATTENPNKVQAALAPLGAEIRIIPNDSVLGETRYFLDGLRLLRSTAEDEATFYGHSKGASHGPTSIVPVQMWSEAMYTLLLESVDATEKALNEAPALGCFRHRIDHAGARWCYGGTFFWLRHSALFSQAWEDIYPSRYGVEGYPGRRFRWGELGTFTPDNVGPGWLYGGGLTPGHVYEWKKNWGRSMHGSVIRYLVGSLKTPEISGKKVIEVGSYDVNGSPRSLFPAHKPASYLGVDFSPGPGVDRVVNVNDLASTFGENSFDFVLSTEMLEHVQDWRAAVNNLKRVVSPGGILLVTTRGPGFPYHGYPEDHWRYTLEHFKEIFSDFEIMDLRADPEAPGVFIKAKKPAQFSLKDLSQVNVIRMVQPPEQPVTKPAPAFKPNPDRSAVKTVQASSSPMVSTPPASPPPAVPSVVPIPRSPHPTGPGPVGPSVSPISH